MYGKKIKNLAYTNHKSRVTFNSKFGFILSKLELRLNVLMLRMGFVNKLQQADFIISLGEFVVNNVIKHKRYSLLVGDLTSFNISSLKVRAFKRFKKLR
jgi:ribosomal protein S4